MKRNSGILGKKIDTSLTSASGVHDTFDNYNARRSNLWPRTFAVESLSINSGTIFENSSTTFTVTTVALTTNTTFYWTILNGSTTSSDFASSVVSGSFTISSTTQSGTFTVNTAFIGNPSKATRTFQIEIRSGSTSGPVLYTSGTFSIPAITSTVSWSTSTINENSASSTLQLALGNIGNYTIYTVSISYTGSTATGADFTVNPLPTLLDVGQSGSATYSLTFTTVADATTEGTETLAAQITYNGFSLGSATLTITDSSTPITATVTPTASSVNEGSSVTFNISITSGNFSSGTLYWTLLTSGSVVDGDFSSPSNAVTSGGSVSISGSAGSVTFTITSDATTESGAESFQFRLRAGSTSGTIIATSSSVTINDTSQTGAGYTRVTVNKTPTLGTGGHPTYPPSGWTGLQNSSADDANVNTTIPTFTINSTNYTTVFIGSNTYLTFGSGSTNYSGLSASNPALNKVHIGAADNSYQRVSRISSGTNYTRIRYEGNGSTSGTVGSPGIVFEVTFFNQALTGNVPVIELLVGNHNRLTGQAGIASTSAYYQTFTLAQNTSYVFVGNSTGTSWTIFQQQSMSGTGY